MKKVVKILIVVFVLLVAFIFFRFVIVGGSQISDGVYKIQNEEYKGSTLIVKDNSIHLTDIDLNEIFQPSELKLYNYIIDHGMAVGLSDKELERMSDLNETFVNNEYIIEVDPIKVGTFTYRYDIYDKLYKFGFIVRYDAFHKTVTFQMGAGVILEYKK